MNPYIIIAALLAVLGAGASGFKLGRDSVIAGQAREDAQIEKAVQAANTATAEAIAGLKPKYTTIQNKLEKQIIENVVFRDCKLNAESFKLVNEALAFPLDQKAGRVESFHIPSAGESRGDAPTPSR